MLILTGYIPGKLCERTYDALIQYGQQYKVQVDFVDVSGSLTEYWHAIRERWTGEQDLITVEQDNVITEDTIPSFCMCSEPWCCYSYLGPEWLPMPERRMIFSLGCTKFSAGLQRAIPHEEIFGDYAAYYLIDERFQRLFRIYGFYPHVHGEVEHLHDYENDFTKAERERAKVVYELSKSKFFDE